MGSGKLDKLENFIRVGRPVSAAHGMASLLSTELFQVVGCSTNKFDVKIRLLLWLL